MDASGNSTVYTVTNATGGWREVRARLTADLGGLHAFADARDPPAERRSDGGQSVDPCAHAAAAARAAPTSSLMPVSRSETAHRRSIALAMPGRRTGRRTAGPLLPKRGA